jgi:hypothetical protein
MASDHLEDFPGSNDSDYLFQDFEDLMQRG